MAGINGERKGVGRSAECRMEAGSLSMEEVEKRQRNRGERKKNGVEECRKNIQKCIRTEREIDA